MIWRLDNPVRPYAWGSRTALATWLGREASGEPEAELWLGAHAVAPSQVEIDGAWRSLPEVIAADPAGTVGPGRAGLPFLLKVLAVAEPLSVQAHPNAEQARAGFEREEAAGLAPTARSYRDAHPKPELLVALERFDALCGVRPEAEISVLLTRLGLDDLREVLRRDGPAGLAWTMLHAPPSTLERVVATCRAAGMSLVVELSERWPGDPAAMLGLVLARHRLAPGEALLVEAGQPHCYLEGVGVEVMASSDNVVRGGLTRKHVDVAELLRIGAWEDPTVVRTAPVEGGVRRFPGAASWFSLTEIDRASAPVGVTGPAIALCLGGTVTLTGEGAELTLARGQSAFVAAKAGPVRATGSGRAFVASVG